MREVLIGEYIKNRRLDLGLSQEAVCEGCCAVSTLSRLEGGKLAPGHTLVHILLQRLGLPGGRYFALLNDNELAVDALKKDIRADELRFRRAPADQRPRIRAQALEKLDRLEALAEGEDQFTRQYILNARVTLGKPEGPYGAEEKLELLTEAIRLTVPRFDPEQIGAFRYSINETTIINQIAVAYAQSGERKKAAGIYSQLLQYIETNDQELPKFANHFCLVAHDYAINLTVAKQYQEAVALAERGWEICVSYGDYQFLPGFLAILAECKFFLGEEEESKKLYLRAYYTYGAYKNHRNREIVREDMQKYLGLRPPY